jgi:chlorite dismutase
MTTPIHMLYLIKRKEAWYQLTSEERSTISAQTVDATKRAGGKRLILCDTTWSSGDCEFFELTEFPEISAVQKRIELYEQVDLFRYYEITTILGLEMSHH